jgi:hypothetical protein
MLRVATCDATAMLGWPRFAVDACGASANRCDAVAHVCVLLPLSVCDI